MIICQVFTILMQTDFPLFSARGGSEWGLGSRDVNCRNWSYHCNELEQRRIGKVAKSATRKALDFRGET